MRSCKDSFIRLFFCQLSNERTLGLKASKNSSFEHPTYAHTIDIFVLTGSPQLRNHPPSLLLPEHFRWITFELEHWQHDLRLLRSACTFSFFSIRCNRLDVNCRSRSQKKPLTKKGRGLEIKSTITPESHRALFSSACVQSVH